eukprot:3965850-Pleurochrysis_carterae.AAC.1
MTLGRVFMRMRRSSVPSVWSHDMSRSGGVLVSRGLRCVGVSTMSGPEGWGTVNTPLPLALEGVWWCSIPVWGSETRVAA